MELGTNMPFEKILPLPESIERTAAAGFKYIDFDLTREAGFTGDDEEGYFLGLKKKLDECGVTLYQAHAPYVRFNSSNPEDFTNFEFFASQLKAIKRAKWLGVSYLVYHPYIPYGPNKETTNYDYSQFAEENFARNVAFFKKLKPYLDEYGVKGAIENCYAYDWLKRMLVPSACSTSKELKALIEAAGADTYACCLDVGHLNLLQGESVGEFIENMGNHLKVLHLNDNFGALNDWFGEMDRHLPPFYGCVNWKETVASLKKIGYTGVFNFELNPYGPLEMLEMANRYVYETGKYMLENF